MSSGSCKCAFPDPNAKGRPRGIKFGRSGNENMKYTN